jgi:hypothetical protein
VFVYRRLGRHWGVGFGLPVFIFIVLPLWIGYEVAKAVVIVTAAVIRDAYRIARWAWRRWRRAHPPPAA